MQRGAFSSTSLGNFSEAEHVIKLNLARRHLDPLRWGLVFKMLLEVKGVVRGKGGDRRSKESTATVAVGQVATELGVPKRTAEHRLRLADTYESLPRSARSADLLADAQFGILPV